MSHGGDVRKVPENCHALFECPLTSFESIIIIKIKLTVHAESIWIEFLAWRTHTSVGRRVEDETLRAVANALAVAVDDEAAVGGTWDAVSVVVEGVARRAYAVLLFI